MTSVYVLETGEEYEGSWIVGIYSTYGLALAALPEAKAEWNWHTEWTLESEDYWTCGCDYICITHYTVDERTE